GRAFSIPLAQPPPPPTGTRLDEVAGLVCNELTRPIAAMRRSSARFLVASICPRYTCPHRPLAGARPYAACARRWWAVELSSSTPCEAGPGHRAFGFLVER